MKYLKSLLAIALTVSFLNVAAWNSAYAFFGGGDTTNNYNTEEGDTYNTDNRVFNRGGEGGAGGAGGTGIGIGFGGSAKAYGGDAIIKKGAVDIDNKNTNLNTNINSNKATSDATAVSGSVSGASAGARAGDNVNIVAPTQVVNVVDTDITTVIDFNHITPDIGKTSADFIETKGDRGKLIGMADYIDAITLDHAKRMAKDTTDTSILEAILFEMDFRTNMITRGTSGSLMGTITITSSGDDVTADGMWAVALVHAMTLGATHFDHIYETNSLVAVGSKAGFDLGGAASVVAKSDGSAVVAPGATLGYSHAWSSSEYRPSMVFALYFDASFVR